MSQGSTLGFRAAVTVLVMASAGYAITVDFNSVPIGTVYGPDAGDAPGDVVLTQPGVEMSVQNFFLNGTPGFFGAQVGGPLPDTFPTPSLELDNISVLFDFASAGFDVNLVTLEFQEFGGADNFAVNEHTIFELQPPLGLGSIPVNVAPNVVAEVDSGVIRLTGAINSFRIGGQELAIDTITAVPDPATLIFLGLGGALYCARRQR